MTKHLHIRLYVLLLAIVGLSFIFSCTEKDPLVVTGNIEGTVSDIETNSVIQGVNVSLATNGNSTFIEQSKATGSDGKFSFKDLEAGSYKLSFKKDGYEDNSKNISLIAGQTSSSDIGMKPVKPKLTVSKTELNFGTSETSLTFQITNSGKGELKWEVKEGIDWLTISPPSGSTISEPSSVSVNIDRKTVNPGNYERTISVTSNGGDIELLVKVVIEGPKIEVSPLNLDFGSIDNKKILLLKNIGVGSLDYTISTDASWISTIPNSGNITNETDQIEISVSRNGLNYGNFSGKINIISKGNTVIVDVKMIVPDPNKPQLSVSPKDINLGNKDISTVLTIKNSGFGTLEWSLSDNQVWIDVSKKSGSLTSGGSIETVVTINRTGLVPNNYSGLIIVSSNGGSESCNVQMEIPSAPVLFYDPGALEFSYNKESLLFTIKNNGTGNLNWNLSKNKDWINLSESSGTNQSSINVTVDRSKLVNGIYSGQVGITSNGGTANIIINVEKRNPNTPPKLDFAVTPSSGFFETNFGLTINCSDDYTSTENLLTRWKWQDEDQYSNWSTSKNTSHTYSTSGTKNITVQVKDQDDATTTIVKSVVVSKNEKPVASFIVSPISGSLTTEFTVDASASSDDYTSKGNLQIRWQWEDNAGFSDWTLTKISLHKYLTAGNKTITLEVKDEAGLISSTTLNLTILDSEKEPNGTKDVAQIITLNGKINGVIDGGYDFDYYTFTPKENGNFYFSVKNLGPDTYSGGCYLYAEGYDNELFGGDINYITATPYLGSMAKVTTETVPVSRGVKYYIKIRPHIYGYGNSLPYELSTVFVPNTVSDNGEPNDDVTQATTISLNSTIKALIGYSDDEDYYSFTPTKDGNFSFTIKNLHPSGISDGNIGVCSLYRYGDVNSITSIGSNGYSSTYGTSAAIPVASSKTSITVVINKDLQYIIKVTKSSSFESAPYELKTTFQ